MQTTSESSAAVRAEILARLIHGEPANDEARRAYEQVERVAQAVGTDRRRAIVWLRYLLDHEEVALPILVALGFDRWLVEAADTPGMRHRESVRDCAKRVAACNDADVLAVAVAAIDDQIGEGTEEHDGTTAAYKKARRVLKRAAGALAKQQPGDAPPTGGVADNRPTAPDLRDALMTLVEQANGAQDAMMRMMRGPGNVPWEVSERLSLDDLHLLVAILHGLMQVVAMLVIDVTALEGENTYEDRMTLAEYRTRGVSLTQAMEAIAQTIARRLRDFHEAQRGERVENGNVH